MNEMITWSPGVTLESIEKQVILKALRFYRGNKTATANALGIAIRTLDHKMEKYEQEGRDSERLEQEQRDREEEFQRRARGIYPSKPLSAQSETGLHVEPAPEVAAQQSMPVPKREEVQNVSSRQARAGGERRHR